MDVRKLVGMNLRRRRLAKGLSQEGLAFEAGIDRTYVSGLERGVENPTILLLDRLATALGCEFVQLIDEPMKGEVEPPRLPTGPKPKGRNVSPRRET